MTATNHAITGALVATVIRDPLAAIILSFAAHFAMDVIPHFRITAKNDMERYKHNAFQKYLAIDLLIAGMLLIIVPAFILTSISWWLVVACMFACMSPDLMWGWRMYKATVKKDIQPKNKFSSWHTKIQWSETQQGIVLEVVWFIATFSLVVLRR